MALLKCTECGADVSSKSEVCMTCGYPISSILEDMERIRKKKKNKLIKILAIILLIVAVILTGIFVFLKTRKVDNKFIPDIKWGTSFEDTKNQLIKEYSEDSVVPGESEKTIIVTKDDYLDEKDVDAMITFEFEDESLIRVNVFVNTKKSDISDEELLNQYKKELIEMYGKCEKDDSNYVWETKKCKVKLDNIIDDLVFIQFDTEKEE